MCGIVGVVGQILGDEEKVFKQLLEVDALRGRHSTGVIKVNKDKQVEIRKKAVDGMDFVKLEGKWISSGVSRVLIGHNRYATKGAINDVNAHPFTHGHIHGVHNGTLTNQYQLKDNRLFDVDSDNMFYDMAHNGIRETAKKITGAWTIALYDEQQETFNMFRNAERPMAVAITENGKTMYFASEAPMLEWVLDRNGVKYNDIVNLTVGKMITLNPFNLDTNNLIPDEIEISDIEYKPATVVPIIKKKTLHEFGLKPNVPYPIAVNSASERAGASQSMDYEVELLVAPYNKWNVYAYQVATQKMLQDAIDNDTIMQAILEVGYNSNMPHCWGSGIVPAESAALEILEQHNEEIAQEAEQFSDEDLEGILRDNGFTLIDDWKDSRGHAITRQQFLQTDAGQNGCCMCGDIFTSPSEVIWSEHGDTAMCADCVDHFDRMYGNKAAY
ncbi:glutamine-fructose-6-phosphate aminotransferase [Vibrio phage Phriendly]|nr:glutamine-fructose-6-phosphate aminotransferase [Vibrio phage Phriendly]